MWGNRIHIIMAMVLGICVAGCRSVKYVPVETERVAVEYRDRVAQHAVTDSVVERQSVYVSGDTVLIWRDRWRTRRDVAHDTLYIHRTDTLRRTVVREVPAALTRWQRLKIEAGGFAIGAVIVALAVAVAWLIRRFRARRC